MREGSYALSSDRGQKGRLWQLDDGRWKASYRQGGRDARRPARTFATKTAAAAWLRQELDQLASMSGDVPGRVRAQEAALTVDVALDRFLAAHDADPVTIAKLRQQLKHLRREFGARLLASLEPFELQAWRKTLPAGSRHDVFRAAKQALAQAQRWHWLEASPAAGIANPRPRRKDIRPAPWETIQAISAEIDQRYEALPLVCAGLGLRPEEWIALNRDRDIDLDARRVYVREVHSQGRLLELGADGSKSWRQRRYVPIRDTVYQALRGMLARIDTPLLFPAPAGGYLDLEKFRARVWVPALQAAGVPHFPLKDLRHVYASESLAAGVSLFSLSRRMGTSLAQIDATYGHLVQDADQHELALLNAWDAARAVKR